MRRKLKVLFINTNCSLNKGSAAQVISTSQALKKLIHNSNSTLISYCPELDSKECTRYGIRVVGYPPRTQHRTSYFLYRLLISVLRCLLWRMMKASNVNMLNERYLMEYRRADIVIDLSGDSFSDSKGGISMLNAIGMMIAILLKKPLVLYSQSIGPFRYLTMPVAKFCLNRADLIIVRETLTEHYLKSIGVNKKVPIHVAADCAFLLEPTSWERLHEIMAIEGIHKEEENLLVGLSVSELEKKISKNNNKYIRLMAQLIDYLVLEMNAKVIFVPHVMFPPKWGDDDDRAVAREIVQVAKTRRKSFLIEHQYTPNELKRIIGQCDLFIGSRMHANIAALSMHVPTIAISWSHKYYGIMQRLGLEEYVCDLSTITFEELRVKVNKIWSKRNEIQKRLIFKIMEEEKSALYGIKLVRNLIKSTYAQE